MLDLNDVRHVRAMLRGMTVVALAVMAGTSLAASAPAAKPVPIATEVVAGMSGTPDPQMKKVIDTLRSLGGKPIETLDAEEARKQPTPTDAVKEVLKEEKKSGKPEPVADVSNKKIPGPAGSISIRIYTPKGPGPFPVVLYVHGGGWVIADLDTYDASARAITNAANAIVVSTDYRQAPENKFPAAHDDVFAAYQWVLANAGTFKGDPKLVAVAGESAGGNMAAATALRARDQHIQLPVRAVLIYPVANYANGTPSQNENSQAIPLNTAMLGWFYSKYLKPGDGDNPQFSIARANLRGLPPVTLISAQIDPLRSEDQLLAAKLKAAGVDVNYKNFDGVTHEFFGMGAVLDKAKEAVNLVGSDLKKSFASAK